MADVTFPVWLAKDIKFALQDMVDVQKLREHQSGLILRDSITRLEIMARVLGKAINDAGDA